MKKIIILFLITFLGGTVLLSADDSFKDIFPWNNKPDYRPGPKVINVWSFNDLISGYIDKFMELHPDFDYEINSVVISTYDGIYQPELDAALAGGEEDAPDIYVLESAFVQKYIQGEFSRFAAPYKELGIDVDKLIEEAGISRYIIDIGTNPDTGEIIGLSYGSDGGALIYRRSIARDVWGTDDPEVVGDITGPGWKKFLDAAKNLRKKGYRIVAGRDDVWTAIQYGSQMGWIEDGKLCIDPSREAFLDIAKIMSDNNFHNDHEAWGPGWFDDLRSNYKQKKVFAYLGPAWFVNYVMAPNSGGQKKGAGTFGDWALALPPSGFYWGGVWIMANKNSRVKKAVGEIIEWMTLDYSNEGLQYFLANGALDGSDGTKETVASKTVMARSDGSLPFLDDQNIFNIFIPADNMVNCGSYNEHDSDIGLIWLEQVDYYVSGVKTKEKAMADFKAIVSYEYNIPIE